MKRLSTLVRAAVLACLLTAASAAPALAGDAKWQDVSDPESFVSSYGTTTGASMLRNANGSVTALDWVGVDGNVAFFTGWATNDKIVSTDRTITEAQVNQYSAQNLFARYELPVPSGETVTVNKTFSGGTFGTIQAAARRYAAFQPGVTSANTTSYQRLYADLHDGIQPTYAAFLPASGDAHVTWSWSSNHPYWMMGSGLGHTFSDASGQDVLIYTDEPLTAGGTQLFNRSTLTPALSDDLPSLGQRLAVNHYEAGVDNSGNPGGIIRVLGSKEPFATIDALALETRCIEAVPKSGYHFVAWVVLQEFTVDTSSVQTSQRLNSNCEVSEIVSYSSILRPSEVQTYLRKYNPAVVVAVFAQGSEHRSQSVSYWADAEGAWLTGLDGIYVYGAGESGRRVKVSEATASDGSLKGVTASCGDTYKFLGWKHVNVGTPPDNHTTGAYVTTDLTLTPADIYRDNGSTDGTPPERLVYTEYVAVFEEDLSIPRWEHDGTYWRVRRLVLLLPVGRHGHGLGVRRRVVLPQRVRRDDHRLAARRALVLPHAVGRHGHGLGERGGNLVLPAPLRSDGGRPVGGQLLPAAQRRHGNQHVDRPVPRKR